MLIGKPRGGDKRVIRPGDTAISGLVDAISTTNDLRKNEEAIPRRVGSWHVDLDRRDRGWPDRQRAVHAMRAASALAIRQVPTDEEA